MLHLFSKKSLNPFFKYTLIGLFFIIGCFAVSWINFLYSPLLTPLSFNTQNLIIEFKPGTSLKQLANQLKQQGVLKNPRYFSLYARLKNQARRVQAGEYALSFEATPAQVLKQLVKGEVLQYYLTIVEGWTVADLLSAIKADEYLQPTADIKDINSLKIDTVSMGNKSDNLEGCFYPDTYAFPRGTTSLAFLKRAYQRMSQELFNAWEGRDKILPYKTPYEALIAASLVEKETSLQAERPLIASVILNRLDVNMPLQIDAAVLYGVRQHEERSQQHLLTRTDLRKDTPYNTYRHRGLPPAPIALPSLSSIQAVLHPAATQYLYYVAVGDGTHYFSKTLKEHNAAVLRYQQKGHVKDPVPLQETAHAK
ncbi:MAG: putative YceG family [Gammaproteobacteria bacterium]|jgi:UPF0755 protein|nr:putative YceG family [Gammaproteobacteria bacterium]